MGYVGSRVAKDFCREDEDKAKNQDVFLGVGVCVRGVKEIGVFAWVCIHIHVSVESYFLCVCMHFVSARTQACTSLSKNRQMQTYMHTRPMSGTNGRPQLMQKKLAEQTLEKVNKPSE